MYFLLTIAACFLTECVGVYFAYNNKVKIADSNVLWSLPCPVFQVVVVLCSIPSIDIMYLMWWVVAWICSVAGLASKCLYNTN